MIRASKTSNLHPEPCGVPVPWQCTPGLSSSGKPNAVQQAGTSPLPVRANLKAGRAILKAGKAILNVGAGSGAQLPAPCAQKAQRRLFRFIADDHGIAAVEAAVAISAFAIIALILGQIYVTHAAQERLQEGLRFAAQYVMNGGTNLTRMNRIFEKTYDRAGVALESELVCVCPVSVGVDGEIEQEQTADAFGETATRVDLVQDQNSWPQCTNSCDDGELALAFGRFSAQDTLSGGIIDGEKNIAAEITVRLIR